MMGAEQIVLAAIGKDTFWAACRAAFAGQSGVTLQQALCSLAHPLAAPVGRDALETYRQIGRAEVVNLLLKYSAAEITPAHLAQIQPNQNHGQSEPTLEVGSPAPQSIYCQQWRDGRDRLITTRQPSCPGCRICTGVSQGGAGQGGAGQGGAGQGGAGQGGAGQGVNPAVPADDD
jgi:hypothetical protein